MSKDSEKATVKGRGKAGAAGRADRQAEALRANLQRRKQQSRARREDGKTDADGDGAGGEG